MAPTSIAAHPFECPTCEVRKPDRRVLPHDEFPGFVLAVEAEVEEREEDPHYDVVIFVEGQETDFVEVELNAETGEVTEIEFETEYED